MNQNKIIMELEKLKASKEEQRDEMARAYSLQENDSEGKSSEEVFNIVAEVQKKYDVEITEETFEDLIKLDGAMDILDELIDLIKKDAKLTRPTYWELAKIAWGNEFDQDEDYHLTIDLSSEATLKYMSCSNFLKCGNQAMRMMYASRKVNFDQLEKFTTEFAHQFNNYVNDAEGRDDPNEKTMVMLKLKYDFPFAYKAVAERVKTQRHFIMDYDEGECIVLDELDFETAMRMDDAARGQ